MYNEKYLKHWRSSERHRYNSNGNGFKCAWFLLDFMSAIGIQSAIPEVIEDADIMLFLDRIGRR